MPDPAMLTRKEAIAVCGVSLDTLRRYDRAGRLPGRRVGTDGTVTYSVADLVAAGLLDPVAANGRVAELAGRSRAERDLAACRLELAVAAARLEHAEREVAFLRSLLRAGHGEVA